MALTRLGLAAAGLAACVAVAGTTVLVPRGEGQETPPSTGQPERRPPALKPDQDQADPQRQAESLRDLAEARLALARRGLENAWALLYSPPAPGGQLLQKAIIAEDLINWSIRWMEAEQDMDGSEAARVAAIQRHIDRLEDYRPRVREMSQGGGSGVSQREVDLVEYALLDAKSWLLKVPGR